MAAVPQILKNITFTLGGADYSLDVLDVAVVPTPGATQSVLTLDGVAHTDVATETWSLDLRCIIDWDTVRPGLASYLNTNKGSTVAFIFRDTDATISTTKPAMTGNCVLQPIPYGGTGNTYAEATVSLPLTAAPTVDTTP
jgi:hypothetical protein